MSDDTEVTFPFVPQPIPPAPDEFWEPEPAAWAALYDSIASSYDDGGMSEAQLKLWLQLAWYAKRKLVVNQPV